MQEHGGVVRGYPLVVIETHAGCSVEPSLDYNVASASALESLKCRVDRVTAAWQIIELELNVDGVRGRRLDIDRHDAPASWTGHLVTHSHRLPALALYCERRAAVMRGLLWRLAPIHDDVPVIVKGSQHSPRAQRKFHSDPIKRVVVTLYRKPRQLEPRVNGYRSNVRTSCVPPLYPLAAKRLDRDPTSVDRQRAERATDRTPSRSQTNAEIPFLHSPFLLATRSTIVR